MCRSCTQLACISGSLASACRTSLSVRPGCLEHHVVQDRLCRLPRRQQHQHLKEEGTQRVDVHPVAEDPLFDLGRMLGAVRVRHHQTRGGADVDGVQPDARGGEHDADGLTDVADDVDNSRGHREAPS